MIGVDTSSSFNSINFSNAKFFNRKFPSFSLPWCWIQAETYGHGARGLEQATNTLHCLGGSKG